MQKRERKRERIPENGLGKARYEHERKPSPFLHNGLMENQVVFLFADITMVMIALKVALQFYRENVSFSQNGITECERERERETSKKGRMKEELIVRVCVCVSVVIIMKWENEDSSEHNTQVYICLSTLEHNMCLSFWTSPKWKKQDSSPARGAELQEFIGLRKRG